MPYMEDKGQVRNVPDQYVDLGLKNGAKLVTRMEDKGEQRWIPNDYVQKGLEAGARVVEYTSPQNGSNQHQVNQQSADQSMRHNSLSQENIQDFSEIPTGNQTYQQLASGTKNIAAGALGSVYDTGKTAYDLGKLGYDYVTDNKEGMENSGLGQNLLTEKISSKIDQLTGGYTKDTNKFAATVEKVLGGFFGGGPQGKALQAAGKAIQGTKGLSTIGKGAEKIGGGIQKIYPKEVSGSSVGTALGTGTTLAVAEEYEIPLLATILLTLLGGGAGGLGGASASKIGNLVKGSIAKTSLGKGNPALTKLLEQPEYKSLAEKISKQDINAITEDFIQRGGAEKINKPSPATEKGIEEFSNKIMSEFPEEIQMKIREDPRSLSEAEKNIVIDKTIEPLFEYIHKIEEKQGIKLSLGEKTGAPLIKNLEDSLANKAHITEFDIHQAKRRDKIVSNINKLGKEISPNLVDAESSGNNFSKQVKNVYNDIISLRSKNWKNKFGEGSDSFFIPVDQYLDGIRSFARLDPLGKSNEVAIAAAKKILKSRNIKKGMMSPNGVNEHLKSLNEDIQRFSSDTFSHRQLSDLKKALDSDLDRVAESGIKQAKNLREARAQWAEDSKLINKLDETTLLKKIHKGDMAVPEKVSVVLDKMEPSEFRATLDALKRSPQYHETLADLQKYYIEKALKAATNEGEDLSKFSALKFIKDLPERKKLDMLFEVGTHARNELDEIMFTLRRIRDHQSSRGGAPTAQRLGAENKSVSALGEVASETAKGNYANGVKGIIKYLKGTIKSDSRETELAKMLLDPSKHKEILKHIKVPIEGK